MKFENLIEEKSNAYGVKRLMEDMGATNGGAMGGQTGEMDSSMPAPDPAMSSAPMPEQGAETQKPVYDKPYQDLAKLLYQALRVNFDELEESQQRKIMALHPDDVKDDNQGVAIFKTFEAIFAEQNGPEPEDSVEGEGGFGPAAS